MLCHIGHLQKQQGQPEDRGKWGKCSKILKYGFHGKEQARQNKQVFKTEYFK